MENYPNFCIGIIHTELSTTSKQSLYHYISVKATEKIREETKQALANSTEKENEYFAGIRRDSVMEMDGKICGTDYWN